MTSIVARITASKILTKQSFLRPLQAVVQTRKLGTEAKPQQTNPEDAQTQQLVNPLAHPDFFHVHNLFTIKDLFDAKVHLGHKEGTLEESMKPHIFGSRLGHLIIDLDKTGEHLRAALNIAAHIAFRDGVILFVSRNPQFAHLVDQTAKGCQEFSHTRKWREGLFTDSISVFGSITRLPDLCIFIHTLDTVLHQHVAISHAAKMCIPSIGIVDTNCSTRLITYPVPGNDDTPSAVQLYCKLFSEAIMRGKQARKHQLTVMNQTVQ